MRAESRWRRHRRKARGRRRGAGGARPRWAARRASRQATAVASAGSVETASAARQPQRTITHESERRRDRRPEGDRCDHEAVGAGAARRADPARDPARPRRGTSAPAPMPSTKRRAMSAASVDAAPAASGPRPTSTCSSVAATHHHEASSSTRRVPQRSASASARHHEQRVAEQERAEHAAHLRLGEVQLVHQQGTGDRHVDAAEIARGRGRAEQRHEPPLAGRHRGSRRLCIRISEAPSMT